jgi:hypothetical protein
MIKYCSRLYRSYLFIQLKVTAARGGEHRGAAGEHVPVEELEVIEAEVERRLGEDVEDERVLV